MGIQGTSYNELGSQIQIQVDPNNPNAFSGQYVTAVGQASGTYPLTGRFSNGQKTLGWVVSWTNNSGDSESTTAWSGQYEQRQDGEAIVTMWLLASETQPSDDWESTLVGKDLFQRQQPTPPQIASSRAGTTPAPSG